MKIGIVVGRFQVTKLHKGHRALIEHALARCDEVLIVLGVARSRPTDRNPLSFELRKAMIKRAYPRVKVAMIEDYRSDELWSDTLDTIVGALYGSGCDTTLYGSRDSCLSVYRGSIKTEAIEPLANCNGTDRRWKTAGRAQSKEAFLAGVIHRELTRAPIVYPTIDVAVMRADEGEVLLCGKACEAGKLRFIGGFVDPEDNSLEDALKREVFEETSGIEIGGIDYVGSARIDDWRYRDSKDAITTAFFKATYVFGAPKPKDDIVALKWVPLARLMEVLVDEHKPLGELLVASLNDRR